MAGWLVGWWVYWTAAALVDCLAYWTAAELVDWLVRWPVVLLAVPSANPTADQMA
jgi:hypothetical protein